jgi:hypothetical protein
MPPMLIWEVWVESTLESVSSTSSRWRLSVLRLLRAVEALDAARCGEDGLGEAVCPAEAVAGEVGDVGSGGMRSGVGGSLSDVPVNTRLDAGCALRGCALCWMRFWDADDAACRAWREAAVSMAKSAVCDLVVGQG